MQQTKNEPEKYSREWFAVHGPEHGHDNAIKAMSEGWPIRLSKSAFMAYLGCARKYWWTKVAEVQTPSNHHMVHGVAVHRALENLYGNWKDEDSLLPLTLIDWEDGSNHEPHLDWDPDEQDRYLNAVEALVQLEAERLRRWGSGHFAPEEFEVKHTVPYQHEDNHPFILVGKIDGVHRHPDGGLVITELKTGKATNSKLSKTRKELAFYRYMLSELGWDEAVYFYYLFPECENYELFNELSGKRNTEVWLGDVQGMAVLEKVTMRSVNAMHKSLQAAVEGITGPVWDMTWNDYFCNEWCEFNMACESEMLGVEPDPTGLYTAEWED